MKLYFLRHADALADVDDAARALSPLGRQQTRQLGGHLRGLGIVFDHAFSSPLVRAQQTLAILLGITNAEHPLTAQETPALLNETAADTFAEWLARLPDEGRIVLVGHEPTLSARVRRMLGLERVEALGLAKGALACVKTADRRVGTLKFLLTPKSLGHVNARPL